MITDKYSYGSFDSKRDHLAHSPSSTLTQESLPTNSLSNKFNDSHSDNDVKPDSRATTKMKAFIKSYYSCDSFLPPLDLSKVAEYSCSGILSKDDLKRFIHPDISNNLSQCSDIDQTNVDNEVETGVELAANLLVQAKILHQRALISEDKAKIVEQELADANLELKKTCQRYQALNASHQEMRDQFWDLELHIQGLNAQIHNLITANENLTEENQAISRKLAHAMNNLTHLKDRETELMESLDAGMKKYDMDTAELHRTILKMHEDLNILERQSIPYKSPNSERDSDYHFNSYIKPSPIQSPKSYDSIPSPINERNSDYQFNSYTKSNSIQTSQSYEKVSSPLQSSMVKPKIVSRPSDSSLPKTPCPNSYDKMTDFQEQSENSDSILPLHKLSKPNSFLKTSNVLNPKDRLIVHDGSVADSGYDGSLSRGHSFSYENDIYHRVHSSEDETSSAVRPYRGPSSKQRMRLSELPLYSTSPARSRKNSKTPGSPPHSGKNYHKKSESNKSTTPVSPTQEKVIKKSSSQPKIKIKERLPERKSVKPSRATNYQVCTYQVPSRRKTKGMSRNWEILSDEFNASGSKKVASRVFDLGDRLLIQEILKGTGSETETHTETETEEEHVLGHGLKIEIEPKQEAEGRQDEFELEEEKEVQIDESLPEDPDEKEEVISLRSFQQFQAKKSKIPDLTSRGPSIVSLREALNTSPSTKSPSVINNGQLPGPSSLALPIKSASVLSPNASSSSQSPDLPNELAPSALVDYFSDVAQAVQVVMAGEFLYKSSRGLLGQERRALRFFWVNPQAKYLYWSDVDPGTQRTLYMDPSRPRSGAKSVFICAVRLISDPWAPSVPDAPSTGISSNGLGQAPALSIVIETPGHSIKLKARSEASHKLWETALFYLQSTVPTLLSTNHNSPVSAPNSISSHSSNKSGTDFLSAVPADAPMAIQGIQRGHFVPSPAKQKRLSMFTPRGNW